MKITLKDEITEAYDDTISELFYQHNLKNTKEISSINKPLAIIIKQNIYDNPGFF